MPRPRIEHSNGYLTQTEVREILKEKHKITLSRYQFNERIDRGVLPLPTVTQQNGLRLFNRAWVRAAVGELAKKN